MNILYKNLLLVSIFVALGNQAFGQTPRVIINEIMANNQGAVIDGFGEEDDWIELYNTTDSLINLGGMFLTDDLDEPTKYQIPVRKDKWTSIGPKAYAQYWADTDPEQGDRHMNFRLDKLKGVVALFDQDTVLVDKLKYGIQEPNWSVGRAEPGSKQLANYSTPTPNAANVNGLLVVPDSVSVAFGTKGGLYPSSLEVSLSSNWDAPIYYTTDGSDPTRSHTRYTQPISIDSTTVIRASVFKEAYGPSRITTQTYFIGEKSTLSVVSLSTDPKNLWDKDEGIYVNPEKRGWERSAHVEYFDRTESGEFIPAVNKTVDIRIAGKTSRRQPKRSFNILANERDGDKKIKYKLFDSKDIDRFEGISVRADATSGRNVSVLVVGERFKNELIYEINDQMNGHVSMQAYEPVLLFLNGEYYGIYNMMERKGRDFLEQNHGVKEMDILTYQDPKPVRGTAQDYDNLITYIQTNDITQDSVYAKVCEQVDIDSYVDNWVYETYAGAHDIGVNTRCWRSTEPGSKWKWITYDEDSWNSVYENSYVYFTEVEQIPLFGRLILNTTFRDAYLNRTLDFLNTTMRPENVLNLLEKITTRIATEVDRDRARWEDTMVYIPKGESIAWMKEYAVKRPDVLRGQMIDYFKLGGTTKTVRVVQPVGGKIRVNSLTHDAAWSGTYLENLPIEIEAIPDEGYTFVKWKGGKFPKASKGKVAPSKIKQVQAVFKKV